MKILRHLVSHTATSTTQAARPKTSTHRRRALVRPPPISTPVNHGRRLSIPELPLRGIILKIVYLLFIQTGWRFNIQGVRCY